MGYWDRKTRTGTRTALTPLTSPPPQQQRSTPQTYTPQPTVAEPSMCPSCGSTNYGGAKGAGRVRCFDCNYGVSYQNSTQGDVVIKEGIAKPAKQVSSRGYDPTHVIGRVD